MKIVNVGTIRLEMRVALYSRFNENEILSNLCVGDWHSYPTQIRILFIRFVHRRRLISDR